MSVKPKYIHIPAVIIAEVGRMDNRKELEKELVNCMIGVGIVCEAGNIGVHEIKILRRSYAKTNC